MQRGEFRWPSGYNDLTGGYDEGGGSGVGSDPLGIFVGPDNILQQLLAEYDARVAKRETGYYDEEGNWIPELPTGRKWEDVIKDAPGTISDEDYQKRVLEDSKGLGWEGYIKKWQAENPGATDFGDFLKKFIPFLGLGSSAVKIGAKLHDWLAGTKNNGLGSESLGGTNPAFDEWFRNLDRGNDNSGGGSGGEDVLGNSPADTGTIPDPSKPGGGGTFPPFSGPTGTYDYGYGTSPVALTGPQVNQPGGGGFDIGSLIQTLMQNGGGHA
jgi:hypothetical protein